MMEVAGRKQKETDADGGGDGSGGGEEWGGVVNSHYTDGDV